MFRIARRSDTESSAGAPRSASLVAAPVTARSEPPPACKSPDGLYRTHGRQLEKKYPRGSHRPAERLHDSVSISSVTAVPCCSASFLPACFADAKRKIIDGAND